MFILSRTSKVPFYALVFTLRSKVALIWRHTIRPVIAQSIQFSKIGIKLYIDLCQFFSHWKEALFFLKSWNIKWGSTYSFLLQKVHTKLVPSDFWERTGASSKWHVSGSRKKALKNQFSQNLHRVKKMVLKWKSKWGSQTQQHVYWLHVCYAHSQHFESHLSRKQPQAKILI